MPFGLASVHVFDLDTDQRPCFVLSSLEVGLQNLGFGFEGSRLRVEGLRLWIKDSGLRV